jgi:DNA-binding CsgD family transcriptional regulator
MLAVDDVAAARPAAEELAVIAAGATAPFLGALAAYSTGAVALADGDAQAAIGPLRKARSAWADLDAPYEAARARLLIGRACRELGDEDSAAMELDSTRRSFAELGAAPDVAAVDALLTPPRRDGPSGLTGREVEVLELVAAGKTNRQIAEILVISEKTVARHVSNIFTKLEVSSRAAAAGYAIRHGLA